MTTAANLRSATGHARMAGRPSPGLAASALLTRVGDGLWEGFTYLVMSGGREKRWSWDEAVARARSLRAKAS
jgi:hypothetical protein